jgi:TolB-like protein/DNA-binding winged helix-turn-helix (wHTH) protein
MSSIYRIEDLTLDTGSQKVLRNGNEVPLGPLSYKLLLVLVEKAPDLATHDEIADAVWSGRAVSPETVKQRAKLLRDALADDAGHPRYIEVVRGRGYRLLPPINTVPANAEKDHKSRRLAAATIVAVVLIATTATVWFSLRSTEVQPDTLSLAVLPFSDMTPEQNQEYFADGVSEEIIDRLSKATKLKVIARTSSFSFKGREADISEIAGILGVTHILEGSIRKVGNRVRVTARLVDASDRSRVWSESYKRDIGDIFELQDEIAASVAAAISSNLQTGERKWPPSRPPVNPEAYELYLLGKEKLRIYVGNAWDEAMQHFEHAIAIDPEFIPAYHSLGQAYIDQVVDTRVPMPENRAKLRDIVERGLSFAPADPGLTALGGQIARWDRDFGLAEQRLRQAWQDDPANIFVGSIYAGFKLDRSHPDEALQLSHRLLEIDPLNPHLYTLLWAIHLDLGNAEEAMAAARYHDKVAAASAPIGVGQIAIVKLNLLGDVADSIRHFLRIVEFEFRALDIAEEPHAPPLIYYFIGDLEKGDSVVETVRKYVEDPDYRVADEAYQHLAYGEIEKARGRAAAALDGSKLWAGDASDEVVLRLALDALIENGEAHRAIEFIEKLAPIYRSYRPRQNIAPQDFSPPPIALRSAHSSYPALYFADYIRALRAIGDNFGADNMLGHLESILEWRRKRGLFVDERYTAEALALRRRTEAALDALEKAERDRTIYNGWQLFVLHNKCFAEFRDHPRFLALIERIRNEMKRQREELAESATTTDRSDRRVVQRVSIIGGPGSSSRYPFGPAPGESQVRSSLAGVPRKDGATALSTPGADERH